MPSNHGAPEDNTGKLITQVNDTSLLIEQAHTLLAQFETLEGKHPDRGWELVGQLQQILNRMREIWPPRVFMPPGRVNPKAPSR